MDYETWCKQSKDILAQAEKYNKWREETKENLLAVIGPRLTRLNKMLYMGCGFHYALEKDFAKLISHLSIPWQPCANWCKKIEDDISINEVMQVIYESLIEQIAMAFVEEQKVVDFTDEQKEMFEIIKDEVEIINGKVIRKKI